jgi:peroxisomal 2,4-dienoyl-CoA reductase
MDIDVLGSYNTLKATIPYLVESAKRNPNSPTSISTGGRIIFISATFHYTGMPLQTHVSVAKAGVDALSANVGLEFGPFGVTSNIITPGPIAGTEGMERLSSDAHRDSKRTLGQIPLGRWGTVKEIADATVYLFGDTGNYVNSSVLVVDGGSWRIPAMMGAGLGEAGEYPNFLLNGTEITGVKGKKGEKAKL